MVSILSKTSFAKFSGIRKPYDVPPGRFLKFKIALVSSGTRFNNKNLLKVFPLP